MQLLGYLTEVAQRAGKELSDPLTNKESLKSHLLRGFNLFHKDFNNRFSWPWREKTWSFQTTPNYTTGTVTVTQGSRTVMGVGTVWTSAMEGRFIKLNREIELYEIARRVSNTELTLAQSTPYIRGSSSGESYLIWQKYYNLPPDCPYSTYMHLSQWPYASQGAGRKELDSSFNRAYTVGFPQAWALGGVDRRVTTYTVNSGASISQGSRTLTVSGAALLDNAYPGSRVTLATKTYNVETIDSDTQATLVQMAESDLSNVNVTFTTKNRTRIILSSVPDPAVNLFATYYKKQYDLTHDEDESEMWEGMEHIIADVLYGYLLEKLTSDKAYNWLTLYRQEVREAWQGLQEVYPIQSVVRRRLKTLDGYRRSLYG